ncbi:MAG: hypothetical protein KF875_06445 [Trueperaceae bacterium]|jgi:hypothetical protein|nr:hypothetical protein [Trueperaceae bacterium]MCC6310489.1 hypothetical protein [Trueperaceae bacterium]MCO5173410.1 hypothetical protein [Trueperaceae bacterium]MCW5819245.1 hypothetical protein [Trueperaceae bacterium]
MVGETEPRPVEFTTAEVAAMLAAQGYRVPESDLEEITERLRGLVAGLMAYDAYRPFDVEPWSEWPRVVADERE